MSVDFNQGFEAGLRSGVHQMQERVDKAEAKLAALRAAAAPFTSVGRTIDERLADHWCHHHDHFVGHYRGLVAAVEVSEHVSVLKPPS